jgi:hypothetical protein
MNRQIVRIAPWQAGKVSAVVYFAMGVLIAIPLTLMSIFVPPPPGQPKLGIGFAVALPFLYALAGLVFVPFGCWLYNIAARLVGGLSITVEEDGRA